MKVKAGILAAWEKLKLSGIAQFCDQQKRL